MMTPITYLFRPILPFLISFDQFGRTIYDMPSINTKLMLKMMSA